MDGTMIDASVSLCMMVLVTIFNGNYAYRSILMRNGRSPFGLRVVELGLNSTT
jgi:hypothetical protein